MNKLLAVAFAVGGLCVSCASTQPASMPAVSNAQVTSKAKPVSNEKAAPAKVSFSDIFELFSEVKGADGIKFGELSPEKRDRAVIDEFAKEIVSQGVSQEQIGDCMGQAVLSSLAYPIPSNIWSAAFFKAPRSVPKPYHPGDAIKKKRNSTVKCQNILQTAMNSLNKKHSLVSGGANAKREGL